MFKELTDSLFIPHANSFRLGTVAGINVYAYLYLSLLLSFLLLTYCQKKRFIKTNSKTILFNISMTLFVVTLIFQTIGQAKVFSKEFKTFHNKSLTERNAAFLGNDYLFLKLCRDRFQGYHRAELVTDMDMTRDPGMYLHRMISYHLYPIDLRVRKDVPIDAIIAFHKKNARESVPQNFRVLVFGDQENLLAVREDLLK